MRFFDIAIKMAALVLFFNIFTYAQEGISANNIQLLIKQEHEDSLNLLTFELTNLSQEVLRTTAVGLGNNRIILMDKKGEEIEYTIWARTRDIYIGSGCTKKWQIDIEPILGFCSYKGFQYPDTYTIKWKIIFWDKQHEKNTIYSQPFYYEKINNSDIDYHIRTPEINKESLRLYIVNEGRDTILISNQYKMLITDTKKQSVVFHSNEKPEEIMLLQSRYYKWDYNMNEMIESYELEGLEQFGEYTIQWKFNCSDLQKNRSYESETPVFTYTKDQK